MGARPISTYSALNASNPYSAAHVPRALPINDASDPTDEEIKAAVQSYLANQASLMNVTKRSCARL